MTVRPSGVYLTALLTRFAHDPVDLVGAHRSASTGSSGASHGDRERLALGGDRGQVHDLVDDRRAGRPAPGPSGSSGRRPWTAASRSSMTRRQPEGAAVHGRQRRLGLLGQVGHALEDLEVAGDRGEGVLQLVRHGGDQLALVGVEGLQLLDQPVLALERAGVEDGAAQVVTDVGGGVGLVLGPLGVARGAGQHQVAEALGPGAQRREQDRRDADAGQEGQDQVALLVR